jgi:cell division inhibitor SulA
LAIVEANQDKRLDLTGDASGDKSVVTLLRALRSELKAVTAELERLDPVLETLSTQVAWQAKSLRQQKFVFQEIEQQQTLRKDLILQIQELSGQQHRGEITCEILHSANSGVRVEPVLRGHLLAGGALGIASSAVLFCLFVLSASMAQPEVEAADRSE